jgi:hypothetical protein
MSDEQNRRAHTRLQQELAELDTPQARYQAQLDRFWWQQRAAEAEEHRLRRELDEFGLGIYD